LVKIGWEKGRGKDETKGGENAEREWGRKDRQRGAKQGKAKRGARKGKKIGGKWKRENVNRGEEEEGGG